MNDDLTAGEFQAMTGLSAKALRLYAERGILTPAAVDQGSGYRRYSRTQLQHGFTVDLLRRAQVPLTELATAADFPFAKRREQIAMRRQIEDFYLDVAEQVASFDPRDFTAHSTLAPALPWVGVIIDSELPEDVEGWIETYADIAVEGPAVESALAKALDELGAAPAEVSWTAVPDAATKPTAGQMLLARPGPAPLDEAAHDLVAERVHAAAGRHLTVLSGTLPRRLEVTFSPAITGQLTPVEEAAADYLRVLAFTHHTARHGLTAIRPSARQVTHGDSMVFAAAPGGPTSVFDAYPPD